MAPLLSVRAKDIDVAGRQVDEELPVEWLSEQLADAEATAKEPGQVSLRLSRSGVADIVVRGRIKATFYVPCARSGLPAPIAVDNELTLLLKPGAPTNASHSSESGSTRPQEPGAKRRRGAKGKPAAEESEAGGRPKSYEFSADEAEIDTYDGQDVVLDAFVREALLLEIPIFPLSPEAEGATDRDPRLEAELAAFNEPPIDPPIDPRLAPLAALKARLPEAKSKAASPEEQPSNVDADDEE